MTQLAIHKRERERERRERGERGRETVGGSLSIAYRIFLSARVKDVHGFFVHLDEHG